MPEDDDTTQTAATRWAYTNDVITGVIVCSIIVGLGYGLYTGRVTVDLGTLISPIVRQAIAAFIVLMGVWLYGDQAVEMLLRIRGR